MDITEINNLLDTSNKTYNLSEAYFGKNKNILGIQKNIQAIIDSCKYSDVSNKAKMLSLKKYVNVDKYTNEIEKLIKNEFKFDTVVLDITQSFSGAQAATLQRPITEVFKPVKVVKNSSGVRVVNKGMSMVILLGDLLFFGSFTASEVTAILLHEIGHNFYGNNNYMVNALQEVTKIASLIVPEKPMETYGTISATLLIRQFGTHIIKYIKESPLSKLGVTGMIENGSRIISYGKTLYDNIKIYLNIMDNKSRLLSPTEIIASKSPAIIGTNMLTSVSEKFADNFVSSYGYGPDLSRALSKLESSPDFINSPIVNILNDVLCFPQTISDYFIASHPNTLARINDQSKYLKHEINNIESKKIRAELEKQIIEIDELKDNYIKTVPVEMMKNGQFFSAIFSFIMGLIFKGFSPQTLIGDIFASKDKETKDWKQFKSSKSIIK